MEGMDNQIESKGKHGKIATRSLTVLQVALNGEWGGGEIVIRNMLQALKDRGHRVLTVTRPENQFVIEKYSQVSPVFTLPFRNTADIATIYRLAQLIDKYEIDILHTHASKGTWTAILAALLAGRGKVFFSRHTTPELETEAPLKTDWLHRWFFKRLAGVLCVSELVRQAYIRYNFLINPDKVKVTYNGIDADAFIRGNGSRFRQEAGLGSEEFVIGYIGRLYKEKGVAYLIEALAILKGKGVPFKALIVGSGFTGEELVSQVNVLGLTNQVIFYGFTPQVADAMNAIDVMVHPCIWREAFGLALCEAMVCGKPVITTDTGAQREIVQHGVSGLIVPPKSPEDIAKELEVLYNKPSLRRQIGENGRKTVLERFCLSGLSLNLEKCYLAALGDES